MNRYKSSSIFLLLSALFFTACDNSLLDTVPNDRLSSGVFWKTDNDAKMATNSLYTFLDSTNIFTWDALTDIAHVNQNIAAEATIDRGNYDALNGTVWDEWKRTYTGIRAVNYFMENVDKITVTDTALINRLKGEARTLRAYQYIKLAALYGDVPLITGTISIAEASKIKRTPVKEIWDFVDAELTAVAPALPVSYGAADKGRITKGAALALKARADLYAGRYQLAADAAEQVMGLGYTLYGSYQQLFSYAAENNTEVILDKQFVKDLYPNNVFNRLAPYSQKSATSYYVPTKALTDAYEMSNGKAIDAAGSGYDPFHPNDNRDPRLRYSIFVQGDQLPSGITYNPVPGSGTPDAIGNTYLATSTGYNIRKYVNPEDYANPTNCGINIILLRYAEVLLTYAEAKIELNTIDASVYKAINDVRQRADVNMPQLATDLGQNELRQAVRHERMVELALEGLRLFDIRRWKTAATLMTGPVYGMTYTDGGVVKTITVSAFTRNFEAPKHYLWPVPQPETDLNPNLMPQNPGW
ncbi:RagB/SusD family nutrient uptake outer membrane protein [Chitinophaga sp. MM2321]|uniref:RagB/SusD family nutrient uptake outer membrane protein n=1 Tax=Chitinophaga sp. MM2321 TaxID=3137178 RepID=UPI0032D57C16